MGKPQCTYVFSYKLWMTSLSVLAVCPGPGEESPGLQWPPAQDRRWRLGVERRRAGWEQRGGQGGGESGQGKWDSTKGSLGSGYSFIFLFYRFSFICHCHITTTYTFIFRLWVITVLLRTVARLTCRSNHSVASPLSLTLYIPSLPDQNVLFGEQVAFLCLT